MRTSLSAAFSAALLPPGSDEIGISLLTIEHPSFSQIYRVCDNNEDVISNGETYKAYAFELAFIDETEGEIPSHAVVLDNTDLSIFEAIRTADATQSIKISHQFVLASDPDYNQLSRTIKYTVASIDVDEQSITGSLVLAVIGNESVPYFSASPAIWPGLVSLRGYTQ